MDSDIVGIFLGHSAVCLCVCGRMKYGGSESGRSSITPRRVDDQRLKQDEDDERLNALRYNKQQQIAQVNTEQ